MKPGTHVEVRSRFEQRWSRGFEIAALVDVDGDVDTPSRAGTPDSGDRVRYRVRRRSDGSILPVLFEAADLREERRRSTWWQ